MRSFFTVSKSYIFSWQFLHRGLEHCKQIGFKQEQQLYFVFLFSLGGHLWHSFLPLDISGKIFGGGGGKSVPRARLMVMRNSLGNLSLYTRAIIWFSTISRAIFNKNVPLLILESISSHAWYATKQLIPIIFVVRSERHYGNFTILLMWGIADTM